MNQWIVLGARIVYLSFSTLHQSAARPPALDAPSYSAHYSTCLISSPLHQLPPLCTAHAPPPPPHPPSTPFPNPNPPPAHPPATQKGALNMCTSLLRSLHHYADRWAPQGPSAMKDLAQGSSTVPHPASCLQAVLQLLTRMTKEHANAQVGAGAGPRGGQGAAPLHRPSCGPAAPASRATCSAPGNRRWRWRAAATACCSRCPRRAACLPSCLWSRTSWPCCAT